MTKSFGKLPKTAAVSKLMASIHLLEGFRLEVSIRAGRVHAAVR
jgi:hypothetical protein